MSTLEDMVNDTLKRDGPRILTIDIETSPQVGYFWGHIYETSIIKVLEHSQVISYSAKWLDGKQITKALPDYKGYRPGRTNMNDKKLLLDIHKLLEEADIVVGQNQIDFDIKVLNARFGKHNIPPPAPYKTVDTKREGRKYFRLPSHKLQNMSEYFGGEGKMEHEGFPLWERCMEGNMSAWKKMKAYNAKDVVETEKLYLKMRPFMKTHPNVGMYMEKPCCTACGNENVQWRGYARNAGVLYRRYQCTGVNGCGHWDRAATKERAYQTRRGI